MSESTIKKIRVMREVCYEEVASLRDRMSQYLPHSAAVSDGVYVSEYSRIPS